jgi:hypothetical protein
MSGKSIFKEYSDPKLWKVFLKLKNIILERKLSKKSKNGTKIFEPHENPYTWKFFMSIFEFVEIFISKMMFLNFKKTFQSLGSEYSFGTDLEVSRHFLFYRFKTNQRC